MTDHVPMRKQRVVVWVRLRFIGLLALTLNLAGCSPPAATSETLAQMDAEAISLLGRALNRPALPETIRRERQAQLDAAQAERRADPDSEGRIIWVGRRLAYLGRYQDAIAVFTEGLAQHPHSAKLRRHRGHRYITLRRLEAAIRDLTEAAALIEGRPDEVEPDGLPNALGRPTSTLHTNVFYHLALAHYLQGEFGVAAEHWASCHAAATNDDMRCAAAYWRFLALSRLGRAEEAASVLEPIHGAMSIIENHAYHQLLLLFKGAIEPDAVEVGSDHLGPGINDATTAYGLAMWHELRGDEAEACRRKRLLANSDAWAAFGVIAAEADLARGACDGVLDEPIN